MGSLVMASGFHCILRHYGVEHAVIGEVIASAVRHIAEMQYQQFQHTVRVSDEYTLNFSLAEGRVAADQWELACVVAIDMLQYKNSLSDNDA